MIARSTLAHWVGQTGVRLQPLVDALRKAMLTEGVIHADETRYLDDGAVPIDNKQV